MKESIAQRGEDSSSNTATRSRRVSAILGRVTTFFALALLLAILAIGGGYFLTSDEED